MKAIIVIIIIALLLSCQFSQGDTKTQQNQITDSTNYPFTFIDSTWLFKGKPFKMNEPIGYYINLFGPYSRATAPAPADSIYTWDALGIMLAIPHKNYLRALDTFIHRSDRLYVVFDFDFGDEKVDSNFSDLEDEIYLKKATKEENDARPHPFYQGSINVGNAALHKGMTANEFDIALAEIAVAKKGNPYMSFINHNALPSFYDCAYRDASTPFQYIFHVNDKGKIEEFQLDLMDSYKKENIERERVRRERVAAETDSLVIEQRKRKAGQ